MKTKITATNMDLTSAIESYVDEKLASIEKFAIPHEKEELFVEIEVGKTTKHHEHGDVFRAEANVRVRGKHFRAVSEKSDLYAAIDDVKDELARVLNSYKGKERNLARKGAAMIKNLIRFGRPE